MIRTRWRQAAFHGFGWGCVGGIALVALMYLANLVLGLRPLSQVLSEPLLSLMPGWMFGFLIDTLQHAGKVVEEAGLIVAMVVALGLLGAATSVAALRWRSQYLPFAFAALGWIVVDFVLLPVGGAGLLGLNDGPATPIMWAALFATYAVVLQMGSQPPTYDQGRRRVLSAVPVTIVAVSLGVLALRLLPDWYRAIFSPPESGMRGPSPAITPVQNFYVVSKNIGSDPNVDGQAWRLSIGGMADRPLKLSLQELRALPATNELVTMECVSNDVGGPLMSTGSFTGVSLRELLAQANPQSSATWVGFKARDGYAESLPMSLVAGAPEILVAYALDGAPLPMVHGYPARVLIPGRYGMKGPKWLDSIDLINHEAGGYWEQQGWDHNAVVKTTARFDVPSKGDIIRRGAVSLAGVAFSGTQGISKVEYSVDNGASWNEATSAAPLSPLTWVIWQATWTPSAEGSYTLKVRAADGSGKPQDKTAAGSFPSGASGYHTIQVSISK
jgi:DMSO/TMAO reductase YedYZ molybdopterin-dependent catalytic subunit